MDHYDLPTSGYVSGFNSSYFSSYGCFANGANGNGSGGHFGRYNYQNSRENVVYFFDEPMIERSGDSFTSGGGGGDGYATSGLLSSHHHHYHHHYQPPSCDGLDVPFESDFFAPEVKPTDLSADLAAGYDPYGAYHLPVDEKLSIISFDTGHGANDCGNDGYTTANISGYLATTTTTTTSACGGQMIPPMMTDGPNSFAYMANYGDTCGDVDGDVDTVARASGHSHESGAYGSEPMFPSFNQFFAKNRPLTLTTTTTTAGSMDYSEATISCKLSSDSRAIETISGLDGRPFDGEYLELIREEEDDNIIFVSNDIETREEVIGDQGCDPWSGLDGLGYPLDNVNPGVETDSETEGLLVINGSTILEGYQNGQLEETKYQPQCHLPAALMPSQVSTATSTSMVMRQRASVVTIAAGGGGQSSLQPSVSASSSSGRSRRKKKDPVEYVLLDASTCGDEKTEFIKYVGKGSYKCQICDIYSKNNKDYIQDHINIKHYNIKKNYECLLCNITFAWRSGAFKHLKKYHSIEGKNTIHYFRAISKRHIYHSQRKRK